MLEKRMMGFPLNMNGPNIFSYEKAYKGWNNVGDPFGDPGNYPFNTHTVEKDVVEHFADRFGFSKGDFWGVLTNSGTDGNLLAMLMHRDTLMADSDLLPVCYFSDQAHHSIFIAAHVLGLPFSIIPSFDNGEMDTAVFVETLQRFRNKPALVVANMGTSFTGAIDKIANIRMALKRNVERFSLHVDAAFFGGFIPLYEPQWFSTTYNQLFDSISFSFHKFFGYPRPAGMLITKKWFREMFERGGFNSIYNSDYLGHSPGLISCSRDALAPLELRHFTTGIAKRKQTIEAKRMIQTAGRIMFEHGEELGLQWAHIASPILYFKKIRRLPGKYTLPVHVINGKEYSRIIIMPHVTDKLLDEFISDMRKYK